MRVLVVDDEKNIRDSIRRYLNTENIETVVAENGLSAKRLLQEQVFSAGIVDLRMPGIDGLDVQLHQPVNARFQRVVILCPGREQDPLRYVHDRVSDE